MESDQSDQSNQPSSPLLTKKERDVYNKLINSPAGSRVVPKDVEVSGLKKYITGIYIVEGMFYVVENIKDPVWSQGKTAAVINGILAGTSVVAGSHLLEGIALRNLLKDPKTYLRAEFGRLNDYKKDRNELHHFLRMFLGAGVATYAGLIRIVFFVDYSRQLMRLLSNTVEMEYASTFIGVLFALPAGTATFCLEGSAAAELFIQSYAYKDITAAKIACTLIAHGGTIFFADTMALSVGSLISNNKYLYGTSFLISQIVVSSLVGKAIRDAYKKMFEDQDGRFAGVVKEFNKYLENYRTNPLGFSLLAGLLIYGSIFQGYIHAELSNHDSPIANNLRMPGILNYFVYATCGILVNYLLVTRTSLLNFNTVQAAAGKDMFSVIEKPKKSLLTICWDLCQTRTDDSDAVSTHENNYGTINPNSSINNNSFI